MVGRSKPSQGASAAAKSAGRQSAGRHKADTIERLPWDNLRLFLAVAEAGSFRSAAVRAGVSINTIRSKVDHLERQFLGPLVLRSVEGVELTQVGREIVQIARDMRDLGRSTARVASGEASTGTAVRIVVPQGIGEDWIVPQLATMMSGSADIRLALDCQRPVANSLFRDVDIAIQTEAAADAALDNVRIASIHIMPFASAAYVAAHGVPGDLEDRKIVRLADDPPGDEWLRAEIGGATLADRVGFETASPAAHRAAIASGIGIGLLPTYMALTDPNLVPIDVGIAVKRDVFLIRHAEARARPPVTAAHDWLVAAFEADRFACFGEAFVHPRMFSAEPKPSSLAR